MKTRIIHFFNKIKESIYRIICLIRIQTGGKQRKIRQSGKKKYILFLIFKFLIITAIMGVLYASLMLLKTIYYFKISKELLAIVIFIAQIFDLISCSVGLQNALFKDNENKLLLVFPVKYHEIVSSRLLIFINNEVEKNLYFLFPFMIAFGLNATLANKALFWCLLIPSYLCICIIPVLIASIISIPLLFSNRFIQSNSLIYTITISLIYIGCFFLAKALIVHLPNPFKLIQQFGIYISNTNEWISSFGSKTLYCYWFSELLFNRNTWLFIIYLNLIIIGLIILNYLILCPFYYYSVSTTAERSGKKFNFSHLKLSPKKKSTFITFFNKELKLNFRDNEHLNNLITTIMILPMVTYLLNYVLSTINTNNFGTLISIAFNVTISLTLLSGLNTNSSCAISSEGQEFAILKTSPTNTSTICWAKLLLTLITNSIAILITIIMLSFTSELNVIDLILLGVTILLVSSGIIMWGFELDIRYPKIIEYATKGNAINNNKNTQYIMIIGFLTSTIMGILTIFFLHDNYLTGWIRIIVIAFVFLLARLYLLSEYLKAYFKKIEM